MTEGQCPSCGAPVAFTAGSAQVVVCGQCQTVVARKGPALEARGKVAALVETDSPLRLGLEGRTGGARFAVVGHLQKDHGAGPWDEWYLEFEDGKSAWLAEAEGELRLMLPAGREERPYGSFAPGKAFTFREQPFVAEEVKSFRVTAAEGQLPEDLQPERPARYVDATGPKGVFLSLEFDGDAGAEAFVGRTVALEELGIPLDELRPKARRAQLAQARCTQCNGPLELRAPDRTKRVACPYCGALLDVSHGKLSFLQALGKPEIEPTIPLGARGTLRGTEWTCIGFQRRACYVERIRYPWDEYLLYHRARGFAWLMSSNGHWTLLTPLAAGDVKPLGKNVMYEGTLYKVFQRVEAETEYVLGEFYWEVTQGEKAQAAEFVAPPYSINEERAGGEVTFTRSEYLRPKEVREAFHLKHLPAPMGIAPSEPNPHQARVGESWRWAGIYALAVLALYLVANILSAKEQVDQESVVLPPNLVARSPEAMHFSQPFEIHKRGNVKVALDTRLNNDWLGVQGDLVNQDTGEVVAFYVEASYYSGTDSDGAWSEGSQDATEYLSAVPPGRYVLRLQPAFDTATHARNYSVQLTSDVPRLQWFLLALIALWVPPLFTGLRSASFEARRWNDSNLSSPSDD